MNLVDKLREESSSEHVAYTEFILKLKRKTDRLFCFFEGKNDIKYYGIRIKNITHQDFEYINCEGKENVIKVYELISKKPEYENIKTSYFIDSDYQAPLEITNIYCLPSYSIENQYVKKSVLKNILNSEFSLDDEDIDFKKVLTLYDSLSSKFHEESTPINAWLACQSDKRIENGIKTHLKIDSTIGSYFKTLIKSKMSEISDLSDLKSWSKINSMFPKSLPLTEDEINVKIDSFKKIDQSNYFRGKFELAFFIDFLSKLQSEICSKSSTIFKSKLRCSLRFEYSTALTNLSIYAETPVSLILYLEKYKTAA